MTTQAACEEMRLLIQADHDGELDAAATAVLAAHVRDCPACAALQRDMAALSQRLRALPAMPAPDGLRRTLEARLIPPARPASWRRLLPAGTFALGAALAASLVLLLPGPARDFEDELVASHIRALQPGHLTDVLSSDRHTVKPWFDGRIDYAPPVMDFAAQGFPLIGGRLDYIGKRPVAALAYRRDKHLIDLYVWPASGEASPSLASRDGYNLVTWTTGGMAYRAVSDLEATELTQFANLWR